MGLDIYFSKTHHLKPREKARAISIECLEDYELLALLLETGTKSENVLELSQRYLKEKGGLQGIFIKSEADLSSYGVKDAKVYRLLAIREIMRRLPYCSTDKFLNAKDVFEKTRAEFWKIEGEILLVFYLDSKNMIMARDKIISQSQNFVKVPIDNIVKKALSMNTMKIITVHNHPSGQLSPSIRDSEVTQNLYKKLLMAQILYLDNIIVGENSYYSFRENKEIYFE